MSTISSGTTLTTGYVVTSDTTGNLLFETVGSERFRIGTAGQWGIGGANYGTSGQVLTSNGSGAAPSWQTGGISTGKAIAMSIVFGG
jgi:hypothetical protein